MSDTHSSVPTTTEIPEWMKRHIAEVDKTRMTADCTKDFAVILTLADRVTELERALEDAKKEKDPDWCWNDDDSETGFEWDYRNDLFDDVDVGEVVKVTTAYNGATRWAARVPTVFDADGCPEEDEVMWFDTEVEANTAVSAAKSAITPPEPPAQGETTSSDRVLGIGEPPPYK